MLTDDQRRATLQTLLQQHELPVIQFGKTSKRMNRTTTRILLGVDSSTTSGGPESDA